MKKNTQSLMFSSKSDEWETPKYFFEKLQQKYGEFVLDPCATSDNSLCPAYYDKAKDGLSQEWCGNVYMNPPYGRGIGKWIEKAFHESQKDDTVVVCLLPSRTDTSWFHEYCMKAREVLFVKGRLKFRNVVILNYTGNDKVSPAPFPSMVVVFDGVKRPKFGVI